MMSAAATKTKPRVMSRGGIIACMVLTLLTPVGLLLIHLAGLRSLGEAYLAPFSDVGTGGALVRRRYDKRGRGA